MVSINSNIAALAAQNNLRSASTLSSSNIARLSSGNKIIQASDDVAGLAIGTVLKTSVNTLRTALTNASQATSMLNVADGALKQIGDILARQKALAVQSNSGSVDATSRGFLNAELQALKTQIDQITSSTNFNGTKLVDGTLFDANQVAKTSGAQDASFRGTNTITLTAGLAAGQTIRFTDGTNVMFFKEGALAGTGDGSSAANAIGVGNAGGANDDETVMAQNIVSTLQSISQTTTASSAQWAINRELASRVEAVAVGTNITFTAKEAGARGAQWAVGAGAGSVVFSSSTFGAAAEAVVNRLNLGAGTTSGIGSFKTEVLGSMGDSILAARGAGVAASDTITVGAIPADGEFFDFGGAAVTSSTRVTFRTTLTGAANEVLRGATAAATAENLFKFLQTSTDKNLSALTYTYNGTTGITMTYRAGGTLGNSYTTTDGTGGDITGAGAFAGGTAIGGIDVSSIANNTALVGKITPTVTATYTANNTVNLSVKIGDQTYTSNGINTVPTVAFFNYLSSDKAGAGLLGLQVAANGQTVANQTEADAFGARIKNALQSLTFYQNRNVDNFVGAGDVAAPSTGTVFGSLTGAKFEVKHSDFSNLKIESVQVKAPVTGATDAEMYVTINGEIYKSAAGVGTTFYMGQRVVLTNQTDPTKTATLIMSNARQTVLDAGEKATAFEAALKAALQIGTGGSKLNFQTGERGTDTIGVAIQGATTTKLYGGATVDISTQAGAASALTVLDAAINTVTSIRADVGALQSRFNFVAANLGTSIQNIDSARSGFLDADISEESTKYAQNQVLIQAGIAVLAQANQLPQNLLKLIG